MLIFGLILGQEMGSDTLALVYMRGEALVSQPLSFPWLLRPSRLHRFFLHSKGWGLTAENDYARTRRLREADVDLIDLNECKKRFQAKSEEIVIDDESDICAGGDKIDTCT